MKKLLTVLLVLLLFTAHSARAAEEAAPQKKVYGTAALMVVVEREMGRIAVFDTIKHELLGRVEGLGNLRHGTVVFSRDARYAYVIARDGTLSKVDLIGMKLDKQTKSGTNSIGIAISRDNRYIMVCNYEPGGVAIFDSESLGLIKEIPAVIQKLPDGTEIRSRTVGPLDTPDNLMIFGLMEGNAVWVVDMKKEGFPVIRKFENVGDTPYDQLTTPDGRYYLVGLLNSDWMGLLDTWKLDEMKKLDVRERRAGLKKDEKVPLYHIPHLESWAIASDLAFVPAFAEKRVIVYNLKDWRIVKSIPLSGTPLFVVVRPGGREVWVDDVGAPGSVEERTIEVIDVEKLEVKKTIDAGKGALDPQFTPKGEAVYISVREEDKIAVYDTDTYKLIKEFPSHKPSGIFCSDRASKFGL